ncbi:hypothetical protein LguiA_026518 [Lonicera macranthoides]
MSLSIFACDLLSLSPPSPVYLHRRRSIFIVVGPYSKLQLGMNDMKIRDDKDMEPTVVDGNWTKTGHIIVTTIGGRNG